MVFAAALLVLIALALLLLRRQTVSAVQGYEGFTTRIRQAYGLRETPNASPMYYMQFVFRTGMTAEQIDSLVARLPDDVMRVDWFTVPNMSPPPVIEEVVFGRGGETWLVVDLSYVDGRVGPVDDDFARKNGTSTAISRDRGLALVRAQRP